MASSPEIYQAPINQMGLSPRSCNALVRAQIIKVEQVLELSDVELSAIRNFSDKCLEELNRKLAERGIARYPKESPQPDVDEEDL